MTQRAEWAAIGQAIGFGWSSQERQARHPGESSTHQKYCREPTCDTTAPADGAHHLQQLEILWRSLPSDNKEIVDQAHGGHLTQEGGEEDAKESCT